MKERTLTDAERLRLVRFDATSEELVSKGYRRVDLSINMKAANVVAIIATVALFAVAIALFAVLHPDAQFNLPMAEVLVTIVVFIVLIVVHELIHGFTWSLFAPNGFKDVEFGVMRGSMTPYCACLAPLTRGPYVLGALMPLLVLGVVPMVVALVLGFAPLLYIGALMSAASVGDVMVVAKVLRYRPASDDVLLFDHPIEAGSVVFER